MSSVNLDVAQKLDITCRRGDTFRLIITFKDSTGTVINVGDIDGSVPTYTFSFEVRDLATDDVDSARLSTNSNARRDKVSNVTIENVTSDGSDGKIRIVIDAEEMSKIASGVYVYDLQANTIIGGAIDNVQTWVKGSFIVNEDVTTRFV
tara:strand:+ start:115 stop:561 length:447 start_codon:yes stop_codon:yes gene_type:complete